MAAGALLRLREYAANRSLWRDEASLVHNVLHRGWLGFDHPLDFNQGTPPGFFVIERTVVSVFGSTELALRAPAVLASILALVVMAVLVRRELDPTTGLVALGLFAGATAVIEYGNEVKQYSLDVLVALLIALVVSYAWRAHLDRRWCLVLGATGAASVWFAHITPFVLVVAGATLAWQPLRRARPRRAPAAGAGGLGLVRVLAGPLSLAAPQPGRQLVPARLLARRVPADPAARQPSGFDRWHTVLSSTSTLVTGRSVLDLLVAVVAVVGLIRLARRQKGVLAMAVGPWLAVVVASAFEFYPAAERMVLFVVPGLTVLLGAGVAGHRRPAPAHLSAAGHRGRGDLRPALQRSRSRAARHDHHHRGATSPPHALAGQARPGDAAYVTETAEPAFDYYADRLDLSLDPVVIGRAPFTDVDAIRAELAPLRGRPRVWIVASAFWRPEGDIDPAVVDALGRMGGVQLARYDGRGHRHALRPLEPGRVTATTRSTTGP